MSLAAKIQGGSALVFTSFLVPHLVNTVAGILGAEGYNAVQEFLRTYYQAKVVEPVLLASIVIHLGASVVRKFLEPAPPAPPQDAVRETSAARRKGADKTGSRWTRRNIHRVTGYIIGLFIAGHVYSCRVEGEPPAFEGLSFLQSSNLVLFGTPFTLYFLVFGLSGLLHMTIGLPMALRQVGVSVRGSLKFVARREAIAIAVLLVVMGVLSIRLGYRPEFAAHPAAEQARTHLPEFLLNA